VSDLGKNIQRIAGVEKINKRLDAIEAAVQIGAVRAAAWMTSAGNVASKVVTGIGVGDDDLGVQQAEEAAEEAAQDALTNPPGGNDTSESDTPEDFFDSIADGAINGAINGIAGGFTDELGYNVGVKFGEKLWPNGNANNFPTPEGFISGTYWVSSAGNFATPAEACLAKFHADGAAVFNEAGGYTNYKFRGLNMVNVDDYHYTIGYTFASVDYVQDVSGATRSLCGGVTSYCPAVDPVDRYFTESINRMYSQDKSGNFLVSPNEQPFPEKYHKPQSKVYLDFDSGNRKALLERTNAGGSMISEVNPITNEPIGTTYVYDKQGNFVIATDNVGRFAWTTPR